MPNWKDDLDFFLKSKKKPLKNSKKLLDKVKDSNNL